MAFASHLSCRIVNLKERARWVSPASTRTTGKRWSGDSRDNRTNKKNKHSPNKKSKQSKRNRRRKTKSNPPNAGVDQGQQLNETKIVREF